jgi:hypothetical protein
VLWSDGSESWKACDEPIKKSATEPEVVGLFCGYGPECPLWPRLFYEMT